MAHRFTPIHFVRLVFVLEDAPEFARPLPESEWRSERDPRRIVPLLRDSARVVRDAVRGRLKTGQAMNRHYDHPIHSGVMHAESAFALTGQG